MRPARHFVQFDDDPRVTGVVHGQGPKYNDPYELTASALGLGRLDGVVGVAA
jgi:hypothetical protein